MKLFIFLFAVELYLFESKGISAGTPVFVLKGEDVLLKVTAADVLQDVHSFSWIFNKKNKVLTVNPGNKPHVFPDYAGRIEFPVNNFSVKLKNLQEADSGVYTARVTTLSGGETAANYKIKVQDRASPVNLTVVNNSVSRNSSSCSFTVTCSSQDSHINSTFTCETRTCSQEGGERSEGIPDTFLQVHQSSGSIICNHSNHVSWTNDTKLIKAVCPNYDTQTTNPVFIILGVFLTILILAITGVFLWRYRRKRRTN